MAKTAVVIGAGIGGLATAIRLTAQGGYDVTVLEKNHTIGGRCNFIADRGFRFDTGPSLLLMTDVYRALFAVAGEDFDCLVPLIKMEPNYQVTFGDGSQLEMSSDLTKMVANLEKIEKGVGPKYLDFLHDASYKYRIGRSKFVERNFANFGDFFNVENAALLGKLDALKPLYKHVSRFFNDERLRQAFSMQTMYLGVSPFTAPAVYTLLAYTELVEDGLYFPKGGLYSLPLAMAAVARKIGASIRPGVAVKRIVVRDGRATGVELEDGSVEEYDVVVSNADLPYTYTDLIEQQFKGLDESRWEHDSFTCSAFNLHLGLDRIYPELRHHNFFLTATYEDNFKAIFDRKTVPDQPAFYVNCVTRTDQSLAPDGCDNLYVLVPVPHMTKALMWDQSQTAAFKERIYDLLERNGLTDLRAHVVVEHVVTPRDWKQQYNLKYGAAFGLSHGLFQVGYFRPANKAPKVAGLYFVGASTSPGTGVPLVCIGADLVTKQIIDYEGRGS